MPPTRWDVKQIPCLQQGTNNKKSGSCWLHVLNFKGKSKKILSSWRCQIDLERKAYQQIMWKLFFEQHLSHEVQRTLIRSQLWQDLKGNMFQRNEWIVGQSIQSMRVWGAAWLTCRVKFHWSTWHNLCLTFWSPQHSFPTASVNQKIGAGDANRSGPMSKTPAHGSDNMLHQKGNLLPFMVLLSGPGGLVESNPQKLSFTQPHQPGGRCPGGYSAHRLTPSSVTLQAPQPKASIWKREPLPAPCAETLWGFPCQLTCTK